MGNLRVICAHFVFILCSFCVHFKFILGSCQIQFGSMSNSIWVFLSPI